ncbi:MAG: hypothetical protein ACOC59_02800 [Bacteroidota bacterium]
MKTRRGENGKTRKREDEKMGRGENGKTRKREDGSDGVESLRRPINQSNNRYNYT